MNHEIISIKEKITYKKLRDVILDYNLNKGDSLLLNSIDFDEIVIEYRKTYGESMKFPHFLLGILIKEDTPNSVSCNRLKIIKNNSNNSKKVSEEKYNYYDGEVVYRCGYCGKIVDEEGYELEGYSFERAKNFIQNHSDAIVRKIKGFCCKNFII